MISLEAIRTAAARIQGAVERTPFLPSQTLSRLTGCELHLKFENLQFTASFKERGALNKLLSLSGELEIHPAHFSGSACGAGLSGKPSSTLAFEKRWNPVLSMDREAFVAHVTRGVPAPPPEIESTLRFNQGRVP